MQINATSVSVAAVEAFRRDLRLLEREIVRQLQAETACCGVTLAQCHVLLEITRAGSLSLSELANALGLDCSTLSRTVDGLVKAGLVLREVDPDDRRAVRLTCTPKGSARAASINDACNRKYAALLGRVSAARRRQIVDTVRFLAGGIPELRHQCAGEDSSFRGQASRSAPGVPPPAGAPSLRVRHPVSRRRN